MRAQLQSVSTTFFSIDDCYIVLTMFLSEAREGNIDVHIDKKTVIRISNIDQKGLSHT